MSVELTLLISVISVCFSIGFGLKNSKRTDSKDIEERVKENTRINIKLDNIIQDTRDIKTEVAEMRKSISSHDSKIASLEASCKSAHHRIDELTHRMDGKDVMIDDGK